MCLLTTDGSGLVVTPEAQSSGARGLLGVVGEVGCEERHTHTRLRSVHISNTYGLETCLKSTPFKSVLSGYV